MSAHAGQDRRRQAPARRRPHGAASAAHGRGAGARQPIRRAASPRRCKAAIAAGRYGLIAEIKKASPSKGLIRAGLRSAVARPRLRARRRHLPLGPDRRALLPGQGRVPDARRARATKLPVLRKDFMIDPYQVRRGAGAGRRLHPADHGLPRRCAGGRARQARAPVGHGRAGRGARRGRARARAQDRQRPDRRQQPQPQDPRRRSRHDRAAGAHGAARTACWWPRAGSARRPTSLRMAKVGASAFLIGESFMRKPDVEAAVRAMLVRAGGMSRKKLTHFDDARQCPHGRCRRQGRDRARRRGAGQRHHAAGDAEADPRQEGGQGRRAGGGAARRHHGGQEDARPDPALPSAGADARST